MYLDVTNPPAGWPKADPTGQYDSAPAFLQAATANGIIYAPRGHYRFLTHCDLILQAGGIVGDGKLGDAFQISTSATVLDFVAGGSITFIGGKTNTPVSPLANAPIFRDFTL